MILEVWLGIVASVGLWAFVKPRSHAGTYDGGDALVVRPCHGAEPGLAERLASGPGPRRLAIATEDDPAMPVARAVADAHVVVTGATGPNAKAEQLGVALADATAEIVVIADSDVLLDDLAPLLRPFSDPAVAAVWAPPVEVAPRTLADRASAAVLDASLHAFALLGALDPGGMVGKLVAIRRADLEAVGGFGALRRHLGEDMELARRLRAHGRSLRMADTTARSFAAGRTSGEVIARYARWLMVIRAQRPLLLLSYPLLFGAALPILVCALARGAWALAAATIAVRMALAAFARLRSRQPRWLAPEALLADVVLWAALFRALATRTVAWRGRMLRVEAGGLLADQGLRSRGGDQGRVSQARDASASRESPLSEVR